MNECESQLQSTRAGSFPHHYYSSLITTLSTKHEFGKCLLWLTAEFRNEKISNSFLQPQSLFERILRLDTQKWLKERFSSQCFYIKIQCLKAISNVSFYTKNKWVIGAVQVCSVRTRTYGQWESVCTERNRVHTDGATPSPTCTGDGIQATPTFSATWMSRPWNYLWVYCHETVFRHKHLFS